jgi:hypothetical protein
MNTGRESDQAASNQPPRRQAHGAPALPPEPENPMPMFTGAERSRWARIREKLGEKGTQAQPEQVQPRAVAPKPFEAPKAAESEEKTVRAAIDEAMMAWRQEAEILRADVAKAVQDLDRAERSLRHASEEAKAMLGREAARLRDEFRQERERSAAEVDQALERIAGSAESAQGRFQAPAQEPSQASARHRW